MRGFPNRRRHSWIGLAVLGACLAAIALTPRIALAWIESHESGNDVTVRIDSALHGEFEHIVGFRIVRGPFRGFDLTPIHKSATVEPAVVITTEDGRQLTGQAHVVEAGSVHVEVDEPKALVRGKYLFRIKYSVDLVREHAVTRDGIAWRFTVAMPTAQEGFEGVRYLFAVPASPSPLRLVNEETGLPDDGPLATLRRSPDKDELEIMRSHVARGETVSWALRLDPHAFPLVDAPELKTKASSIAARTEEPESNRWVGFSIVLAIGVLYAIVLFVKGRAVEATSVPFGAVASGLVPIRLELRSALAGLLVAVGLGLMLEGHHLAGSSAIVATMLLAVFRVPVIRFSPRGPGKWLALKSEEAFVRASSPGHFLDVSSPRGRRTAFSVALVTLGAIGALVQKYPVHAVEVALGAIALVPVFLTGCASQLPPDPASGPARFLARLAAKLGRAAHLRVVPWARIPLQAKDADELRLLVVPRTPMAGAMGLEVGLSWMRTPSGLVGAPEVLVRVDEGTQAADRILRLAPAAPSVPGRRPLERVYRFSPRVGTLASVVDLTRELADALVDRRVRRVSETYEGVDRRSVGQLAVVS